MVTISQYYLGGLDTTKTNSFCVCLSFGCTWKSHVTPDESLVYIGVHVSFTPKIKLS